MTTTRTCYAPNCNAVANVVARFDPRLGKRQIATHCSEHSTFQREAVDAIKRIGITTLRLPGCVGVSTVVLAHVESTIASGAQSYCVVIFVASILEQAMWQAHIDARHLAKHVHVHTHSAMKVTLNIAPDTIILCHADKVFQDDDPIQTLQQKYMSAKTIIRIGATLSGDVDYAYDMMQAQRDGMLNEYEFKSILPYTKQDTVVSYEDVCTKIAKMTKENNRHVVVFLRNIDHVKAFEAEAVKHAIKYGIINNNIPIAKRNSTMARFQAGNIVCLLVVRQFNYGLPMPNVDACMFFGEKCPSPRIFVNRMMCGLWYTPNKRKTVFLFGCLRGSTQHADELAKISAAYKTQLRACLHLLVCYDRTKQEALKRQLVRRHRQCYVRLDPKNVLLDKDACAIRDLVLRCYDMYVGMPEKSLRRKRSQISSNEWNFVRESYQPQFDPSPPQSNPPTFWPEPERLELEYSEPKPLMLPLPPQLPRLTKAQRFFKMHLKYDQMAREGILWDDIRDRYELAMQPSSKDSFTMLDVYTHIKGAKPTCRHGPISFKFLSWV